jgi:hypothetical protein
MPNKLYTSLQDFIHEYPLLTDAVQLELQGNYRNSKYVFYESKSGSFIIKVQVHDDNVPIVNDSLINYTLNSALDEKLGKYFMKFYGSFKVKVDKQNQYLHLPGTTVDSNNEALLEYPAIVYAEIPKALPLRDFINHRVDFMKVLPKLNDFIHCLLKVGDTIGFAHHDMHMNNIFYNQQDKHFVLIDYSMSHVPKLHNEKQEDIDRFLSNEAIKFKGQFQDFFDNPYYCDLPGTRIPKGNTEDRVIYILNDIASLSILMNDFIVTPYREHIERLNKKIAEVEGKNEKRQIIANYLRNRVDPSLFTLFLGLYWYEALHNEYDNYKTQLPHNKDLFVHKLRRWCIMNRDEFDAIKCNMSSFYNTHMKNMVKAWLSVKVKSIVGGNLHNDENSIFSGFKKLRVARSISSETVEEDHEFNDNTQDIHISLKPSEHMYDDIYFDMIAERDNALAMMKHKKMQTVGGARGHQKVNSKKLRKIYVDNDDNRKYVKMSNKKWYLDENRGKYKYNIINGVKDVKSVIVK